MSPSGSDSDPNAATDPDSDSDSDTRADPSPPRDPAYPITRNVVEPGCERCPALVEHRECISWGTGLLDATVLVVGEAPGAGNPDADRWRGGNWTGMAYTSRHSGRRIRRMLDRIGYGDEAYYTNAVKCFPPDPAEPTSNRGPTPEERANCRGHLVTEIADVDPDVILATGKHATKSVLAAEDRDIDGFVDSVLTPVRCDRLETQLVPILHPSYQDVWIGRLGYDPETYLEAIRATLEECCRSPVED